MPINVFGNSSSNSDNKIDTSLFEQNPYLRINYLEINIEEDIDLKNQYRIKNLPDPISIGEPVSKNCVDNKFNDPSILKNTEHIDLNDRNLTNARFIQVNQLPEIDSRLSAKLYADNAICDGVNEQSLLRLDPDEKLKQDSIVLISTLTSPKTIIELPTKNHVDIKFNDPSIIKNTDHVDFNDKILDNVKWIKVNSFPTIPEHLTAKLYVDNAVFDGVKEHSLLRLHADEKLNIGERDSILLNSTLTLPNTLIELPTKSYVDSLHESSRNRRDLSSVFNDEDNEFDKNKLNKVDSVTVNRNPTSDIELACKKINDGSIEEGTIVGFNQTITNYLKVSVGDNTYNLTKYDKLQITDTTIIKHPNTSCYLLQIWIIKSNDRNNNGKIQNFIKSTKTDSPTGYSGSTSLPPIANSFMYLETSSNNHGNNVFVSFKRTDSIQISNITYYYNRFSILTNASLKSMGRFRIKLLLEDKTWSTRYNIPKNDLFSDTSREWSKLSLYFTEEICGIKLLYDQIDTAHADMCFSKITITYSVY